MSYNKKPLQKAVKQLDKAKAPAKPKDIILDPMGQWKHPGQNTRIPSDTITMQGVPYPVYAQPNVGQPQMMYPGQEYIFPEAEYVDEFPQMKKGGLKKNKTSKSISATNKLFAQHAFFEKPKKNRIYNPNATEYKVGGIPNLPLRDNRVAFNNAVNSFENEPFDEGGPIDTELTPEEIEAYKNNGYIVEEVDEYQDGGIYTYAGRKDSQYKKDDKGNWLISNTSTGNKFVPIKDPKGTRTKELNKSAEPVITNKTEFQPGTYDPNELMGHMSDIKEVNVSAKAPEWVKYSNEYEKKHPKENFIYKKKNDYLKYNQGLNKAAGVTYDNFPEQVEKNYDDNYEYNKNNYIVKKLGKSRKFNPNKHGEWIENLSPGELQAVQNSRYGSKLQADHWSRSLAGLQELGNTVLPGQPLKYQIPGLTKKEQKEMRDSKTSALETLSFMDIPGTVIANNLKNARLSTGYNFKEQPAWYSGEKMANVSDLDATLLNPLTYIGGVKGFLSARQPLQAARESQLLGKTLNRIDKNIVEPLELALDTPLLKKATQSSSPFVQAVGKTTTINNLLKARGAALAIEKSPELYKNFQEYRKNPTIENLQKFMINTVDVGTGVVPLASNAAKASKLYKAVNTFSKPYIFSRALENVNNNKQNDVINFNHPLLEGQGFDYLSLLRNLPLASKANGGEQKYVDTELTDDEIQDLIDEGYIIEQL